MKKLLQFSKTLDGTVSLNNQNNKVRTSTPKTRTTHWPRGTPTRIECEARLSEDVNVSRLIDSTCFNSLFLLWKHI